MQPDETGDRSRQERSALIEENREQREEIEGLKSSNLTLESLVAELRHIQQYVEVLNRDMLARNTSLQAVNQELEAFCYAVSHDLRNPLRAVHGFAEALGRSAGAKMSEDEAGYLQRICSAAARMDQLIEDLLRLSRVTRADLRRQRVDLTAAAWEIAQRLSDGEPLRKVSFVIEEGLEAAGDPVLVRVVLENLLGNAWKYTGRRADAQVFFGRAIREGRSVFCIRDNGVGFDMAYASKLFAPFQRLHSAREFPGSGVGLACVARVVHRHGGTIAAEAKAGEGAAFYFTLFDEHPGVSPPGRLTNERQ